MRERPLGRTDLRVSLIGVGCNNFGTRLDYPATEAVVHAALDSGVTLFDTADIYGGRGTSEEYLGRALAGRRGEAVIATKFGMPMDDAARPRDASYRYVMAAAEASLRRLRTDRIDIYLLHRPDPDTPVEETLRALDRLMQDGKVRYAGCCNVPAWQLVDAVWTANTAGLQGFVCCQDQYSLLVRQAERELLPAAAAKGLGFLPYFPLAGGLLTGKYAAGAPLPQGTRMAQRRYSDRFLNERNLATVEALRAFCAERGRSLLELAYGWLLANPTVASVISGASTPEQVRQNVAAADWVLSAEERALVDEIASPPR